MRYISFTRYKHYRGNSIIRSTLCIVLDLFQLLRRDILCIVDNEDWNFPCFCRYITVALENTSQTSSREVTASPLASNTKWENYSRYICWDQCLFSFGPAQSHFNHLSKLKGRLLPFRNCSIYYAARFFQVFYCERKQTCLPVPCSPTISG